MNDAFCGQPIDPRTSGWGPLLCNITLDKLPLFKKWLSQTEVRKGGEEVIIGGGGNLFSIPPSSSTGWRHIIFRNVGKVTLAQRETFNLEVLHPPPTIPPAAPPPFYVSFP